ncbi:MAG: hypothetical protein K5765_02020, partial [Clostridia bacterium]|nr:hypothetical protein [Clostridia bacterium]
EYVHVVGYYNNTSIENVMNTFVQKYKSKDMNNYNETLRTSIQADMAALEALLLAETTKQNEISDLINTINTKLDTQIVKRFIVGEAPEYVSTILSFDINLDDFSGYKNGDEIIITLSKFETNNIDSSISSLGFAFKDGFNLAIQYNDAPLSSDLVSGIDITMNLPNGYLDRQFELFNANNNQKVEIEIENNTMSYTLKNNTNFVLFVSGGINQSGSKINSQDTITVFGNTFTKTTFWLIVGICGGVAVLAIVFGIIIFIKRR